ncbi:MAG: hypothetical protein AB7Q29_12125 [Vicinamibacterales bacterium]
MPQPRWVTALAAVVVLAAAAHLCVDALTHHASWTNNDNALILFISSQMAGGARLYIDWLDPALPSIFFIARIAVGISRLGVPVVLAYNLLVLAAGLIGVVVLMRALRVLEAPRSAVVLTVGAYVFFLMKAGALTRDFGQREHLFALLLVPELFFVLSGDRPRWRPLWCATLAFTATIKPHFVAIVALLEATAPADRRPSRADLAGFAAGAVAPFVLLWGHSSASFRALFTETIDLHLSGAYALLNASPRVLLTRGPLVDFALGAVAIALAMRAARQRAGAAAIAWRGSALIVMAALAVVHQQKYFPYHFTPLFGLAVVVGAWAAGGVLDGRPALVSNGLAAAVVLFGAGLFHLDVARNAEPISVRLARVIGVREPTMAVASIYSHGLCTPFPDAPRCLGPEAQAPRLPFAASQPDGDRGVRRWASAFGSVIRRERPDLVVISTSSTARMPGQRTPAEILLREFPSVGPDYVPLTPAVEREVGARNWLVLRRRDVPEATRANGSTWPVLH